MKQNKYDDPVFFEKYSQMDRSTRGLTGAGEWPALRRLLPDLSGLRMLDLGCGFGWHCQYALGNGARSAVGVDLSQNMIAEGRRRFPRVQFIQQAIEDIDFPDQSFDLILSSLAFHYLADFSAVCRQAAQILSPGGHFIFSIEHPVFTAQGPQDWCRDPAGAKRHWPVDNYFLEGPRRATFLNEEVLKYHRTLTTYLGDLAANNFTLTALTEPTPNQDLLNAIPEMQDELRRPLMLIISAHK